MDDDYRLESFDRQHPAPARIVACMHARLLPTSPAVKLGAGFLESIYYRALVEEGAVFGTVAWVDESPAGFIAVTGDSHHFMKIALRRRFPRIALAGAVALLKQPTRVAAVFEVLRLMRTCESQQLEGAEGEILSMGIEEEYRRPEFVTGRSYNIAIDLLEEELEHLRRLGRNRVRAVVDAGNMVAQLFYRGLGWSLERTGVPGWRSPTVEFVLDL